MMWYDIETAWEESGPVRRTIYLPDELAARVDAYLREHPEKNLSGLVREALESKLTRPDPLAILELAGVVQHASVSAEEWRDARFGRHKR